MGSAPPGRSTFSAVKYWMPDAQCKACTSCGSAFSLFNRKHHCRFCGKIFCHSCSSQTMDGRALGFDGHVRVCDDCKALEGAMSSLTPAASAAPPSALPPSAPQPASAAAAVASSVPAAVGAAGQMGSPDVSFEQDSRDLRSAALGAAATVRDERDAAAHDDDAGARAVGGKATHVDPFASGGGGIRVFDDRKRLVAPKAQLFNQPINAFSEGILQSLAAVSDLHLTLMVRRAVAMYISPVATRSAPLARDDAAVCTTSGGRGIAARDGLETALHATVLDETQAAWAAVLLRLARHAVRTCDPNIRAGDKYDVRLYTKVKTIVTPAARVGDCELLHGVVYRRNLSHKAMQHDIKDPRILILDDAISFEGGTNTRLLSLETLNDQERKYTEILVHKVLALRPDVLFVSKNVSRVAQELLMRGRASFVTNVKPQVLQRLSRCTGARILPSINYVDKLPEHEIIGTLAGRFHVRYFYVPADGAPAPPSVDADGIVAEPKRKRVAYVVVEGCPEHLGCTILLRGAQQDLRAAKRILRHAIFIARNLRLQTLYMFDAYLLNGKWADADAVALAAGHLTERVRTTMAQLPSIPMLAAVRWNVTLPSSPLLDVLSLILGPTGIPRAIGASSSSSALASMVEASDAQGMLWPSWSDVGDPLTASERFESVIVAYCTVADGVQCFKPKLRHFSFYAASDCTLGQFLEERCFDEKQPCKQCRKGPAAHTQCFMHHRGRLEVTVHRLATPIPLNYPQMPNGGQAARATPPDAPPAVAALAGATESARPPRAPTMTVAPSVDDKTLPAAQPALSRMATSVAEGVRGPAGTGFRPPAPHVVLQPLPALPGSDIVTWSYCAPCKRHIGPATRLSRGAWSLSFGKFMELAFYTPTTASPDTTCPHTPHIHHVRYFARNKLAAVMRYTPIAPSEVCLSPMPSPNPAWCRVALEKEVGLLLRASALKTTELTGAIKTLQAVIVACERVYTLMAAAHPHRNGRVSSIEHESVEGARHASAADATGDGTPTTRAASASDVRMDAPDDPVRAPRATLAPTAAAAAHKRGGSAPAPPGGDGSAGAAAASPDAAIASLRQSMADLARLLNLVHTAQQELTQAMQLIMQDVMVASPTRLSTNTASDDVCAIRSPDGIGRMSSVELPSAQFDVLRVMSHRRTWVRTMLDTEEQLMALPAMVHRSAIVIASVATVLVDDDRPGGPAPAPPAPFPRRSSVQPPQVAALIPDGIETGSRRPRGSSSSLSAVAPTTAAESTELGKIQRSASPSGSTDSMRPASEEPDAASSVAVLEADDGAGEVGLVSAAAAPVPQPIADAVKSMASPSRPRAVPMTSPAHLRSLLSKMTPDLLAGRFRQFSAGLGARETADVDSVFRGHLLLPPGLQDTVVPVTPSLTASMLAYSLSSELYWDKLQDVVKAAEARLFGVPTGDGGYSTDAAQVPQLLLPSPHESNASTALAGVDAAAAVNPFHADDDDVDADAEPDGPDSNHIMDEYERTTAADGDGDTDDDSNGMLDAPDAAGSPALPVPTSAAAAGALRSAPSAIGGPADAPAGAMPIPRKVTVRNLSAPAGEDPADGSSRHAVGHVLHMSGSYAQAHITLTPAMSAASRRVSRRSTGIGGAAPPTPVLSAGSPPTSNSRRVSTLAPAAAGGTDSSVPSSPAVESFVDILPHALPPASTLQRATRSSAVPSESSAMRLRLARRTHAAVSVSDAHPPPVYELPDAEIALLRRHSICSPTRQEIFRENRYAALGPGVVIGVEPRPAVQEDASDAPSSTSFAPSAASAASSFMTPQHRRSAVRTRESYAETGVTSAGARISLVNASPSVRHSGFSTLQRLLSDDEFAAADAMHSGRASLLALTPARQSVLSVTRPSFHAAVGVVDGEEREVEHELPARAVRASMSGWSWTTGDLHMLTMTLPPPPQLLPRPPSARRGRASLSSAMTGSAAGARGIPPPASRLRSLPEAVPPGGLQAASPISGAARTLGTSGDDGSVPPPARPPRAARGSALPTDLTNVSRMDAAEAVLLEAQQQAHTAVTLSAGRTTPRATAMRRTSPGALSADEEGASVVPASRSRVSTHQSILEMPGAEELEADSADSGDEHQRVQTMAAITVTATERSAASATALLSFPTPMSARISRSNSRSAFAFDGDAAGATGTAAGAAGVGTGAVQRPVTPAPRPATSPDVRKGRTASGATGVQFTADAAHAAAASRAASAEPFGKPLPLRADEMLLSDVQSDIVHTFSDQNPASLASFSVTSVWAMHFHALRELCYDSQRTFVQSLAWSEIWRASGGKSGASFERTQDDRLVIKHIRKSEFDMFKRYIAPAYFSHMHAALVDGQPSMLVKILGVYKVVSQLAGGPRDVRHVVVMENLFRGRAIQAGLKFDLKGKAREQKKVKPALGGAPQPSPLARTVTAAEETSVFGAALTPRTDGTPAMGAGGATPGAASGADNLVLLDGDLMTYTRGLPLPLTEDAKQVLDVNVQRDTEFLNGLKVIDYSVLVGIDVDSGVIVMGIIDYFRVFDIMSRFEEQVKRGMAVVTNVEPTVVQPERYMSRLRKALDRYFVLVPTKLTLLADGAGSDAGTPNVVVGTTGTGMPPQAGTPVPAVAAGSTASNTAFSAAGNVLEDDM